MTIDFLRENGLILFECISGSHAFGTNKPTSDVDKRGVFICPQLDIYGFDYVSQVSDETNDVTFYEIRRFLELLETNNPNIMEILFMPKENIVFCHPIFEKLIEDRKLFVSKLCKNTFAGYATTQIKKARGLNKKIVNPVEKERKNILDFCYLADDESDRSVSLGKYLENIGGKQEHCGLSKINHMDNMYFLYYDHRYNGNPIGYRGIMNEDESSNEVRLSSIPKGEKSAAIIYFNKDGYSKYCKDYKEYWEWVEKRNEDRYQTNTSHGKNYDSKNMMHCVRLLRMALEIGRTGEVIVRRPDAQDLMKIRNGERDYDELIAEADAAIEAMNDVYANSDLPELVDHELINNYLIGVRILFYEFYNKKG